MNYNRYNNGKIYQIINNIDDMVYIGSTCLPLRKRIYNHKEEQHAGKGPNRRLFVHAQKYGWAEFDIILIEEYPCENRDHHYEGCCDQNGGCEHGMGDCNVKE